MTGPPPPDSPASIPPLVVELDVEASPDEAFAVWVGQPARWWPRGHTVSGAPEQIVFESHVGGRIYERAADGVEHTWGEILVWEPPTHLRFLWHLFFDRDEATTVDLTFMGTTTGTRLRLEQTGWDALGDAGRTRRERTVQGWAAVTAPYEAHLRSAAGGPPTIEHEEQR